MRHIISYLLKHAERTPQKAVYHFLQNDLEIGETITYGRLLEQTRSLAATLQGKELHGKRVLLVYRDAATFVVAFWACAYAGVVPVPVYYPQNKRQYAKIRDIISDAQAQAILCAGALPHDLQESVAAGLHCIDTGKSSPFMPMQQPALHETAFIQYTSGTTGSPKGVVVGAASLLHNQTLIQQTFNCNSGSRILTWLPFQHDMGLVGNILHAVFTGCTCFVLSPQQFMQQPWRWPAAVSRYRITHSGGPDFAYQQCLDIPDHEIAALDLACWQVAYNGAEPVRATTLELFADKFKQAGFSSDAFYPCYGLAEATLLVAGVKAGAYPQVVRVDSAAMVMEGIHTANQHTPATRSLVSCGKVAAGMDVKIISPDTGGELEPGLAGEICIAGESVTNGYWNKDNRSLFYTIHGQPYLRTGDLGYLLGEELFVHARLKEMVILRGRNYYLNDLEETLRLGETGSDISGVAAFRYQHGQEEQVVVVMEMKRRTVHIPGLAGKAEGIERLLNTVHGIRPFDILFISPMALPRTTSGKVRRTQCVQQYEAGAFPLLYAKRAAGAAAVSISNKQDLLAAVLQQPEPANISGYLNCIISAATGLQQQHNTDQHLTEMGLDSISSISLLNTINKDLGITLDVSAVLSHGTVSGLTAIIENMLWLKKGQAYKNGISL